VTYTNGHHPHYGFGRIDAARAVRLAAGVDSELVANTAVIQEAEV
jgi:hypothetical protein